MEKKIEIRKEIKIESTIFDFDMEYPSIKFCLPILETACNIHSEYILYCNTILTISKI